MKPNSRLKPQPHRLAMDHVQHWLLNVCCNNATVVTNQPCHGDRKETRTTSKVCHELARRDHSAKYLLRIVKESAEPMPQYGSKPRWTKPGIHRKSNSQYHLQLLPSDLCLEDAEAT
jgi:hypothetical protein